jgi:hypothetical protein
MGNVNMSHTPTPDEANAAIFFVRWWQEFLVGFLIMITGLYLRSKGKDPEKAVVPISERQIDNKITINKQEILLSMHDVLDRRDKEFQERFDRRNEEFLRQIEKLHVRLNSEAKGE